MSPSKFIIAEFVYAEVGKMDGNELSIYLSDLLCHVIGSKDVIKRRQNLYAASELFLETKITKKITTGSTADWLYIWNSDYDRMYIWEVVRVFEQLDEINVDIYPTNTLSVLWRMKTQNWVSHV